MPLTEIPDVFKTVLEELPVAAYLVDREGKVVFWNRATEKISGFFKHEVIGRFCRGELLVDSKDTPVGSRGEVCQLTETLKDGKPREADIFLHHKSGFCIPVHVHTVVLRAGQVIAGALETIEEIPPWAKRRSNPNQPRFCHHVDFISGLPDRQRMLAHLEEARKDWLEQRVPFCVLRIQPDGLERFQAKYGKGALEAVMQVTAQTLASALHASDIAGSWDARGFVVALRNCPKAAIKIASERIRRMADYSEIEWWGDHIPIAVSIGGATATEEDTTGSLLRRAELALAQSIRLGGDRVTVFPDDQK